MKQIFRFFLAIALLASGLTACGGDDNGNENNNGGNPTLTCSGKVTCGGNGVAGVVVNDGLNFTQTAADGSYTLPYNDKATHIAISSPSGYTVPFAKSIPAYWAALANVSDRSKIDFTLIKESEDDTKHYFVAVGDPQVRNVAEITKLKKIIADLKSHIAGLPTQNAVPVLIAGDIVFNTPDMHPSSINAWTLVNQPVYYAIGNHDHTFSKTEKETYENDKTADANFKSYYGPTFYSFNRGKVHYMAIDNIYFSGGPDASYSIQLTDDQLRWIEKDLSYVSSDRAVVIVAHSPTQTRKAGVGSYGNMSKLHALVQGFAHVEFITGHTHYNTVVIGSRMNEHVVGAACGGFWEGPVCLDGANLGYKVFEVDGTSFKWRYIDYTDNDAAFTVFPPESSRPSDLLPAAALVVNVWDWDTGWTVSCSLDGGTNFQAMNRTNFTMAGAYDPTAYSLFGISSTDGKPNGRQWINAGKTDHLFYVTPSSGVRSAVVKATDRFGREYTKTVTW